MKILYSHLPEFSLNKSDPTRCFKKLIFSPCYWLAAHFKSAPGLFLTLHVWQIALRLWLRGQLYGEFRDRIIFFPIDSVRYFEFDFVWPLLTSEPLGRYLDLSSPRLLLALVFDKTTVNNAILVNPDSNDLKMTRNLFETLGFDHRCSFIESVADNLSFHEGYFDTISSISVIEHIPDDGDILALTNLWKFLKPGGRLLLSVPCASEDIIEYIDFNEYGLLSPESNNFIFGQRFYSQDSLKKRIFGVTGLPVRSTIYGEKKFGTFINNRNRKLSDPNYPFWREPYMMSKDYQYYSSIDNLPGWGVVAMEFIKI